MRYCSVDRNGVYTPPAHPKTLYEGTPLLRAAFVFVNYSALALARASTIAARYCTVRKQFKRTSADPEERSVIEYQSVQYRVFPSIAMTIALAISGKWVMDDYQQYTKDLAAKISPSIIAARLDELHATSSGLKVLSTYMALKGLEDARMACGSHGYSQFSGFPEAYGTFTHLCTAEGENWLLTQQTTRWLIQMYQKAKKAAMESKDPRHIVETLHLSEDSSYLARMVTSSTVKLKCTAKSVQDFNSLDLYLKAFEHRAARLIRHLSEALDTRIKDRLAKNSKEALDAAADAAWQSLLVPIFQASEAHCQYVVLRQFYAVLCGPLPAAFQVPIQSQNSSIYAPLRISFLILASYWMDLHSVQWLEDGYMNSKHLTDLRSFLYGDGIQPGLFSQYVVHAVPVTDSFAIPDYVVNSALGSSDGRVYDRMWDWAVFGGVNSVQPQVKETTPTNTNLNRIYNRELFLPGREYIPHLPKKSRKKTVALTNIERAFAFDGDGDSETEEDKRDSASIREWQIVHSLAIRPLVNGTVARKFSKI